MQSVCLLIGDVKKSEFKKLVNRIKSFKTKFLHELSLILKRHTLRIFQVMIKMIKLIGNERVLTD